MSRNCLIIISLLVAAASVSAQMDSGLPTITQSQLECVSPLAFTEVLVNVEVPAGEAIDYVRVYFRSPLAEEGIWYFVDATPKGEFFSAVFPAPVPEVATIDYRSEIILVNGASAITDITTVNVSHGCPTKALPGDPCEDLDLVIGTTAAEPRLPEGFSHAAIEAVVTESGTMVSAPTIAGFGDDDSLCPGLAAVPSDGTFMGIPRKGAIFGGIVAAGIVGAILIDDNQDDDRSPN